MTKSEPESASESAPEEATVMPDGEEQPSGWTAATSVAYLSQALVAVLVVVVAQVGRVLFPIMFEIGEDWDFVAAGLVAVGVFAAPILAILLPRLSTRTAAVVGSAAVSAVLLGLRLFDPIPALAAVVGVAVALAGGTIVLSGVVLGLRVRAAVLLAGLVLGLALDAVIRSAFYSWDLPWQRGTASLIVTLILAVGLLFLAAATTRTMDDAVRFGARPSASLAIGAYLMAQLLFLHNFAFAGSQAGISLPAATLVVLAGSTAALAAIYAVARWKPSRAVVVAFAVAGAVLAWLVSGVGGPAAVLVVLAFQVILTGLLAAAVDDHPATDGAPSRARRIVSITAGSVLFLVLVLLWQIYIDKPLPFPRQAIPVGAVVIVAWFAWRRVGQDRLRTTTGLVAPLVITAVLAVVASVGLWLSQPSLAANPDATSQIRLVNYNVRGSVAIDGRLSPDEIATEIAASDPDIVVLQEVARGWAIHGTMDLLAYLERELNMTSVFVPAADGQFGNAILSRLPMTEIAAETLPRDGTMDRSYVWVEIETGSGGLNVVGTHTQSRSTAQITALLDAVGSTTPLVIAGDMNVHPGDPEVSLFTDAGLIDVVGLTGDPCQTTSSEPTSECDRPDWVFVTADVDVVDVRIGSARVSDHLAMHVTLQKKPK